MDDKDISKKDQFIFGLGVLITLAISSVSGFLYYRDTQNTASSAKRIVELQKQTPIPTQKPQEKVDYKNTKIQVLNASGKAGLAKIYADKLKLEGYTNVTTGNYNEKVDNNFLFAPVDDTSMMHIIGINSYKYEKSEDIKIVVIN
jgi:hypothetical protein